MADFNEILRQLREHSGEESLPPTLYDDLAHEYQSVVDQRDGATVQIQEKDASIAQFQSEVSRLKSENYDLVISQPGNPPEKSNETQPAHGVAGLFQKRNRT